jgi:hypothetical protein
MYNSSNKLERTRFSVVHKKSLKIPKGQSENVYRRIDNKKMPKEKAKKDKQRSGKHTYQTKHRVTRTPLKTVGELRCSYQDFLDRGLLLTMKLLNKGFLLVKLKSSLRKFPGPFLIHDLLPGL